MSVEWTERAKDLWALIWVTATREERDVFESTYHEINRRLELNAQFLGESRREGERVWFCHPLVVRYNVIPHGPTKITHIARLRVAGSSPPDDDSDP